MSKAALLDTKRSADDEAASEFGGRQEFSSGRQNATTSLSFIEAASEASGETRNNSTSLHPEDGKPRLRRGRRTSSQRERIESTRSFLGAISYRVSMSVDERTSMRGESVLGPEQKVSWKAMCALMLTDIVGTSVLTLAAVAAKLGWGLSILMIVLLSPVAIYTAVLMSRSRHALVEKGYHAPESMGHCALAVSSIRFVPEHHLSISCVAGKRVAGVRPRK